MMKRISLTCLLLIVLLSSISIAGETTLVHKLEFTTPDSLKLTGWLTPGSYDPPAPLIVLLHQYQSDHSSYEFLLSQINDFYVKDTLHRLIPYPHTLAFDLRGHGLSTQKGSKTIDYQDRDESEMTKIPSDIAFAIKKLISDKTVPIDTSQIYVVGASIGANAAIMLTREIPNVAKVVMLSPGENYLGMQPTEDLKNFGGISLIYVGNGDSYSFESSKKFSELGGDKVELRKYKTSDHGTDIVNRHLTAMLSMLDWLLSKKKETK